MRLLRTSLLVISLTVVVVASAGAKGAAVDLAMNIGVGSTLRDLRPQASGATVKTNLKLWAGPGVDLITALPATPTVRFDLPAGIAFGGTDLPDPTEGCTATATTATCSLALEPIAGRSGVSWGWDLVAAAPGSYVLTAELVQSTDVDPDPSNNRATVTVVASAPQPPSGGGGGGGGSASVSAGAVKLSPAKPKAGSRLVASVRVTRGGSPVKPTGVTCTASVAKSKVRGGAKSSSGVASCLFKTPKAGKGKTLHGSVSFRAGGQSFTKRFSAKLG
jgi:hypothetical protein